ncbi:MAG: O-antigen ligase family protein, partial [Anaerolineae bacterium]
DFFASIIIRRLGRVGTDSVFFPFRLTSLALYPTYLSMASLILIPFTAWQMREAKGRMRIALGAVLAGLLVCLVGTESRIAYLAFGAGLVALAVYVSRSWRRPIRVAVFAGIAVLVLAAVVIGFGGPDRLWQAVVVEWRPGSLVVRSRVYEETFRLLPEHPIAGWGVQQRIVGKSTSYSAGSHSSILAMWFRHGIVGLALYVGLWVSIWREVIRGLKRGVAAPSAAFWVAAAIAPLGFNIRELADAWWWDQTVTMALWTLWGLVLAAPASFATRRADTATIAEQGQRT